jgi:nitroimidazol reductase NimA-like FMN-containing flavoprotein (pyridoxamine 5'-phosphate oxidase superfamily)
MSGDPGRKKVIVRRGVKHAEYINDTSNSSTSVMFSGTASVVVLPIYVVYKADHLYNSWTLDGPKGTLYNRSNALSYVSELNANAVRRISRENSSDPTWRDAMR